MENSTAMRNMESQDIVKKSAEYHLKKLKGIYDNEVFPKLYRSDRPERSKGKIAIEPCQACQIWQFLLVCTDW